MGFWAGIKHALNSTLGTADFKPLDEIIKGNYQLVANTSNQLATFHSNREEIIQGSPIETKKIQFKTEGTITIKAKINVPTSHSISDYVSVTFYRLRQSDGTQEILLSQTTRAEDDTIVSPIVDVQNGDVFYVRCSASTVSVFGYLVEASVFADFINNDLISIT